MLALKTGFEPMYFPWEVILKENELTSPLDAALTHVNPNRRRFLGLLLAGVAAAPLLTSVCLVRRRPAHGPEGRLQRGRAGQECRCAEAAQGRQPAGQVFRLKDKAPNPQATKQTEEGLTICIHPGGGQDAWRTVNPARMAGVAARSSRIWPGPSPMIGNSVQVIFDCAHG